MLGPQYYKYYDGSQWNPSGQDMTSKGGKFTSLPAVVSWDANRLDIWGVMEGENQSSDLAHQTWYGSGWYPDFAGWEILGEGMMD